MDNYQNQPELKSDPTLDTPTSGHKLDGVPQSSSRLVDRSRLHILTGILATLFTLRGEKAQGATPGTFSGTSGDSFENPAQSPEAIQSDIAKLREKLVVLKNQFKGELQYGQIVNRVLTEFPYRAEYGSFEPLLLSPKDVAFMAYGPAARGMTDEQLDTIFTIYREQVASFDRSRHFDPNPEMSNGDGDSDDSLESGTNEQPVTCLVSDEIGIVPQTGVFYTPFFLVNRNSVGQSVRIRCGLSRHRDAATGTFLDSFHYRYGIYIPPASSSGQPALYEDSIVIGRELVEAALDTIRQKKKNLSRRSFLSGQRMQDSNPHAGHWQEDTNPHNRLYDEELYFRMEIKSYAGLKEVTQVYLVKLIMSSLFTDIRIPK